MAYRSKAAAMRSRKRAAKMRIRNRVFQWTILVAMGAAGIALGLLVVKATLPDHPWFQ